MTHSITIEIPENIYQPLAKEAKLKGRKIEEVALKNSIAALKVFSVKINLL